MRAPRGPDGRVGEAERPGQRTHGHEVLLGPIDVDLSGSAARAECHVCAWHHAAGAASGDGGVVHGHYIFALEKRAEAWRITAMTLDVLHQSGNTRLLQEASA